MKSHRKGRRIATYYCYGVTLLVVLGLVGATLHHEFTLLKTGTEGAHYPATIYFNLPIPGTSPEARLPGATGADFSQVYTSAKALRAGASAYLSATGRSTDVFGRPAGYPPLTNWVYVPLAHRSYVDAFLIHTLFWIFALLISSTVLLYKAGLLRHWLGVVCALGSLYFLTPIGMTHMERGQFDLVVATASVLALGCLFSPRNQFILAAIAGALGALKWTSISYLGCFAAFCFLLSSNKRRWTFALIPVMTAVGTFGFWHGVQEYWPTIQKYELDATPGGITFEYYLPRMAVKLLPVVLTLAIVGLVWARTNSQVERRQFMLAVSAPFALALMGVAVCFGTLSYEYHTVSLLGLVAWLVVWLERAPLVKPVWKAATALGFGLLQVFTFRVFGFGDEFLPEKMTMLYGAFVLYAFVICIGIVARASPALASPLARRTSPVQGTTAFGS